MGRIRSIKPEFPQSETIGKLSREARLLFIQIWTIVDDAGRARATSRMLASLLYPYDSDVPSLIDGWLTELCQHDCIRLYEVDGDHFLDVPNWLKHQKIDHPSKSRLPVFREASRELASPSGNLAPDLGPRIKDKDQGKKEEDTPNGVTKKYAFESGVIRLNQRDFDNWKAAFSHLNVPAELIGLTKWASEQGQNWFFAISGALTKRNREVALQVEVAKRGQPEFKWKSGIEGVI